MLCPSVCYTIFRYFDNNWNSVYPLQNFLDELFKLPSNSSNPPFPFHRNDHLSHFLFPLFKFFKNTSASSFSNRFLNRSEPTPKSVFTVFRFLLLFSNFFSRSFQITIVPLFSTLFSQGNIQLLSTSSNFLKPQISFLEWLKKENVWNEKKEKRESWRLLSSITSLDRVPPDFHGITSPSRRVFGVVWSQHAVRSFSMHAAGRVRQRGAGRRECDYCNFDEIRATWHERVCPW